MTLPSVSLYPSESEDVTQLAKLMSTVAKETYWTVYWSYEVRCFNVLENAPFRKSVIDTQSSKKMISPKTLNVTCRNHELGIGTFIKKYNWND